MLEGLEHLVRIRSNWCHCLLGLSIKERVTDTGCDDSISSCRCWSFSFIFPMPNWPKLVGHDLWSATALAFKSPRINSSSVSRIPLMVVVILYQSTKWNLSQFAPRVCSGKQFPVKTSWYVWHGFAVFRMLISFIFLSVTTGSGRLPSLFRWFSVSIEQSHVISTSLLPYKMRGTYLPWDTEIYLITG